jgi:phenylalanyl-tRNA synthetase beta chain
VDNYPLPPKDPVVEITPQDVRRWLGIELTPQEIADLLERLEFGVEVSDHAVRAIAPDHRLDIGEGVIGLADMLEEIARIYGYERIPESRMADELPPQQGNLELEREERIRDILVDLSLQEVVTHRMTSVQREARLIPPGLPSDDRPYVKIANPIASDRNVLRHSLISSVLEVVEHNARLQGRIALFEIGPVFLASEGGDLPDELPRLAIALTGPREVLSWQGSDQAAMDFYDLKGILETAFASLRIEDMRYEPAQIPIFHPGKCARVLLGERQVGVMGELHPLVQERYDVGDKPVLAAELDLQALMSAIPERYPVVPVSPYPPVLEDLAVVVDEQVPAERVAQVIRDAGGAMLSELRLFDVYRGEQIGVGKKSLAYSLVYQSYDQTLTDNQVLKIRERIVRRLESEMDAHLRS